MKNNPLNELVEAALESGWFYFFLGVLVGAMLNNLPLG